uniref:Uncharacterized protein n=3 Tax=Lactuca sativa TaxID=4236 RepID=A0A9R1XSH6_LACSA|nr:hypothetical protein LSAT_V11C300149870 [Lactuca sativa]
MRQWCRYVDYILYFLHKYRQLYADVIMQVSAYLLGEYSHLLARRPGCSPKDIFVIIHEKLPTVSTPTISILLSTYAKILMHSQPPDPELQNQIWAIFSKNSKPHQKQRSNTYWSMGSLSDRSMADLIKIPEHNNNNQIQNNEDHRLCAEASRNEIEVLKSNVSRLGTQVEMSDLELESLRKQILKENKRGQDMLKKVTELQEEKEALEEERKKDIATMKEFYGELDICMSRKKQTSVTSLLYVMKKKTKGINNKIIRNNGHQNKQAAEGRTTRWGFGEESFTTVPASASSHSQVNTTPNIPIITTNSGRSSYGEEFKNKESNSASRPAGWAGF